ncbi:hypothetical protein EPUS_09294 [Endocarpon pusillum Z07020]|uniref:Uncharacterized protein n=1 Tax=Endocarpon pusillum (strain Z07020 / HMAS-L-300199) TaxID=1263415 RepID=U1GKV7_ENDPU|nr:uncharacterized protein EPUS_09294 [Endocarpon pusillum Z07020]ERF72516.1 hypothetical protein EPUS_09294 [Endocarpon pusillum Z07020]
MLVNSHSPEQSVLCRSQKIRSNSFRSFSRLGLALLLGIGCLFIIVSWTMEWLVERYSKRTSRGTYQRLEWTVNNTLQLQRMVHEDVGLGTWSKTTEDYPITLPGEHLATVDISEPEHPKLKPPVTKSEASPDYLSRKTALAPYERDAIETQASPPLWSAPRAPRQLKKDSGLVYIAQNAARHPNSPLEPLFRTLYIANSSFDIRSVDVVTDRNNIRKLLSFVNPDSTRNGLEKFTISIEVTKNTAIFSRAETATHEVIGLHEFRGFGHEFEKSRPQEPDYPLLHEIARHVIHVCETLAVASECVKDLKQQQQDFMAAHPQNDISWSWAQSPFQFPLRMLQSLLSRSESNKARVHNEITLAFHTAAQRDSKIQVRIGEEAKKETTAMKAIAVVTMTFLPATFVSSIFSMSFFHFEPSQRGERDIFIVSDKFWMYWVLAGPLSITVLSLWIFWERMLGKKH